MLYIRFAVICDPPRWYKWNIVLFLQKSVLLMIHALELKLIRFSLISKKALSSNQFSIQCKWSLCLNLFIAPLKEQGDDDAMDHCILCSCLSFFYKCLLGWGVKCIFNRYIISGNERWRSYMKNGVLTIIVNCILYKKVLYSYIKLKKTLNLGIVELSICSNNIEAFSDSFH